MSRELASGSVEEKELTWPVLIGLFLLTIAIGAGVALLIKYPFHKKPIQSAPTEQR